ncbi:MAG TPA: M14 family metallopeptidase [Thermoanaerobaculia bacterium]|nr:M14 family metallopeptidase [Thermoanaerobaculia bacterium]
MLNALVLVAAVQAAPLPPALPWNGKTRELVARTSDPWITPAEKSGFRTTPNYQETIDYLRRLTAASKELRMVSIGRSAEGRDIWMVVASREKLFTPAALLESNKPTLLAQGGIHAGEIDGKDAGMMLLRDMVFGRSRALLDRVNFLFVPIFNVDGHERISPFGRINQRGPEAMGWRTTARNLNLNRDYTKLDAPEMRAMVSALNRWKPDLYVDLHVTDGADFQYDLTYGWNQTTGYSPAITAWLDQTLAPELERELKAMGHIPGFFFYNLGDDPAVGIQYPNSTPRLSTGYGDVRHLPTVLVENHSLKPYDQRVLGTVVLLRSMLAILGRNGKSLRSAISSDQRRRVDPVPLAWARPKTTSETVEYLGIAYRKRESAISGTTSIEWLGKPVTERVPLFRETEVTSSVPRAKAYWIQPAWGHIVDRLEMHGVAVERIGSAREVDVEVYRLTDPKLEPEAYEGHVRLRSGVAMERRREKYPAGSWRVSTDQPLGNLVTVLLDPESNDSFLKWGFFHEILQRTEYVEDYVVEPMAEQMLAADPKLAAEFQQRLERDEAFRKSPQARLRFFYERTPYFDERWKLYPVARER